MFRENSSHKIDANGRLIIPVRFHPLIRKGGENGVMVTRMDNTLVAYPFDKWRILEAKILSLPIKSDGMRRFRRIFIGSSSECFLDKNNRIVIPPSLRAYAELKKEVILVGVLDHFEIWSHDNWEKENLQHVEDLKDEELKSQIASLGI